MLRENTPRALFEVAEVTKFLGFLFLVRLVYLLPVPYSNLYMPS